MQVKQLVRCYALAGAALFSLCAAWPTAAQKAAPAPQPPPPAPWGARCASEGRGAAPDCVVEQRVVVSNTNQLLAAVMIRIPPDTSTPVMTIQTPYGLHLPAGLKVAIDDAPPATLQLQTCDGNGCYASQVVAAELLAALKRGTTLTITFQDSTQRNIPVPVSLNGFAAAYGKIQ